MTWAQQAIVISELGQEHVIIGLANLARYWQADAVFQTALRSEIHPSAHFQLALKVSQARSQIRRIDRQIANAFSIQFPE